MVIGEKEFYDCFIFFVKPFCNEYGFKIIKSQLSIQNRIFIDALMNYQNQSFRIQVNFLFDYQNNELIFDDIEGTVKYSFIELPFMQVFKQFIQIPTLKVEEKRCCYQIPLPIERIDLKQKEMIIKIRNDIHSL
jgi:hypothetical protein